MRRITGTIRDSVVINEETVIGGVIQASVTISRSATAILRGKIQGNTTLEPGSRLVITGAQEGSVTVGAGAEVIIEESGKLGGSLHNDGHVVVRGVFGGSQSGRGTIDIEGRGWIKQPDEVHPDGTVVYRWS